MHFKQLCTFLIATLILVSAFFTPLQFVLGKSKHQKFMQRKSNEQAVTLRFSKTDFENPKTGPHFIDKHEFDFDGHRYDIIDSRSVGDEIVLTCRQDDHEKKAENGFAQKHQNENKTSKAQKLIDDYLKTDAFRLHTDAGFLVQPSVNIYLLPPSPFFSISPPPKLG
jgi:hypothetical protein